MDPLASLLATLLTIAVFFEGFGRVRAHRTITDAEAAGTRLRSQVQSRIRAGVRIPDALNDLSPFDVPPTVKMGWLGGYAIAVAAALVSALLFYRLSSQPIRLDPRDWDISWVAGVLFLVANLGIAYLVRADARELRRELADRRNTFAESFLGDILEELHSSDPTRPLAANTSAASSGDGISRERLVKNIVENEKLPAYLRGFAVHLCHACRLEILLSRASSGYRSTARWASNIPRWRSEYLEQTERGGPPSGRQSLSMFEALGRLADARLAEVQIRLEATHRWTPDIVGASLKVDAPKQLREVLPREDVLERLPPAWIFPRSETTWVEAVQTGDVSAIALDRVIRHVATGEDTRLDQFASAVATAMGSRLDGDSLIPLLRDMLVRSGAAEDKNTFDELADCAETASKGLLRGWVTPRTRVVASQALALQTLGRPHEARTLLLAEVESVVHTPIASVELLFWLADGGYPTTELLNLLVARFAHRVPPTSLPDVSVEAQRATAIVAWVSETAELNPTSIEALVPPRGRDDVRSEATPVSTPAVLTTMFGASAVARAQNQLVADWALAMAAVITLVEEWVLTFDETNSPPAVPPLGWSAEHLDSVIEICRQCRMTRPERRFLTARHTWFGERTPPDATEAIDKGR
ncbi:MAG TPA: hypothetical protein VK988_08345 [Acidimicrobiales bacterium]|nr:hypothetical protein [Acidimicrobiales bacterium]